jgi:hypothetical protein
MGMWRRKSSWRAPGRCLDVWTRRENGCSGHSFGKDYDALRRFDILVVLSMRIANGRDVDVGGRGRRTSSLANDDNEYRST